MVIVGAHLTVATHAVCKGGHQFKGLLGSMPPLVQYKVPRGQKRSGCLSLDDSVMHMAISTSTSEHEHGDAIAEKRQTD